MNTKKTIIFSGLTLFIFCLSYLWNNILLFDDNHNFNYEPTEQVSLTSDDANAQGAQPVPQKGHYIFINLDNYMMYVYKNGEFLKSYPVSGGKPSTPSPLGTWKIIGKDTWGEGFGGGWMGFNVPWGKYGIHGTVYPWFIGKSNSSKGCIRMKNKDLKELYSLVPCGTTVVITHINYVFRNLKSGDIGSDVLNLQKALKKLGYYNGGLNGKFGDNLKVSIIKFQKAHKLSCSGIAYKKTSDLIFEQYNLKLKETEEGI